MKNIKRNIGLVTIIAVCMLLFTVVVSAASYPSMYPKEYEYTVTQGKTAEIVFTIFHEYKNEKAHIRVHEESKTGTIVASSDRDFYNYSNPMTEYTVTWDTDNVKPGKYVVEYWMSFYSIFEWHEVPTHKFLLTIYVKNPPCINGCRYDNGQITYNPTCSAIGVKKYTCSICANTKEESIPKTEHTYKAEEVVVEATCDSVGIKERTCKSCGHIEKTAIPTIEHSWGQEIITKQPEIFTSGVKTITCTICKKVDTISIPAIFTDVNANEYYANSVNWAYHQGITNGIGNNKFGPNDSCTRAQVVTFLWRAYGSPEPTTTTTTFEDVKETDYFYKPVLWAIENNITNGTNATQTEFSPNQTCSFAHILTFIWRSQEKPNYTGNGEWYTDAVSWAENYSVLDETDASKEVLSACSRKDVVTYLYRILGESK